MADDQISMGLKIDITLRAPSEKKQTGKASSKGFEKSQPRIEPGTTPIRTNANQARNALRKEERKQTEKVRAQGLSPFGENATDWWPSESGSASILKRRSEGRRARNSNTKDKTSNTPLVHENIIDELKRELGEQKERLQNLKNIFDKTALNNLSTLANNPAGGIERKVLNVLSKAGPHGAIAGAIVTMVLTAPKFAAEGIEILSRKGLPLNRDWTLDFENKTRAALTEEDIKLRVLGLNPYVTGGPGQYIPGDGYGIRSSLEIRDEIRATKQGQDSTARGIVPEAGY
ncbi:MAG: hypothetical protein K8823_1548 [Cenarchaeum symbiont of Oopsacas minuta]|nr:hypothetical protein [Cenarchaeum symbiont of Oopsacas minuta]